VQRRAGWIVRQRDGFATLGAVRPPKLFKNGETHRYLGRQYRLRILTDSKPGVRLRGRYFEITVVDKTDKEAIRRQLDRWYRFRAEQVFAARTAKCLSKSYLRDLAEPKVLIRQMKRRWGSCTRRGTVLLNLELVKTPLICIEYVITHELCHLQEHNHGPAFYRLLERCMPDWRKRKARLNSCEL
jgi:hypothetical protein